MTWSGGMDTLEKLRHASDAFGHGLDHPRHALPLPRLDDRGGAKRQAGPPWNAP